MTPQRWQEVKKVLAAVLERPPEERSVYLDQACTEPALRREVESLIVAHEQGDSGFMERFSVRSDEMLKGVLTSGTKLGPYEILARVGAGGMGEVYEARDTKLGRKVAIKVLPPAFVDDPQRLFRFQREARMLASLNHPNIATIHGLEQSGGVRYLVMELIQGQTLADCINHGPVPLDEALSIARQIAEALEAAHEKGIIHRDLKPANVKVTPESTVKVLDFGLAKALEGEAAETDGADSPTLSMAATKAGVILGTAAYMSPEQARGSGVDKRTDVWAFGCVLYELLTARRAFQGETLPDTIAAVLEREPDWQALPVSAPARVRVLLQRCLQKDPKQRLRDIGDARIAIDEVLVGAPEPSLVAATPVSVPFWRRALPWAVAGSLAIALAALAWVHLRIVNAPARTADAMRFIIPLPEKAALATTGTLELSPDGRQLALAALGPDGVQRIWVRALDSLDWRPLPGSESPLLPPFFWSPDGRYIAFDAGGKLKKIGLSGSAAETLCDLSGYAVGGSWNRDGVIIFGASAGGLMRVSANGGSASPLTTLGPSRGEIRHALPSFLPDGRHFIYQRTSSKPGNSGAYIGSLDAKPEEQDSKRLLATDYGPAYAPSSDPGLGQLLFMRDGTLMAQPFDARRLELSGEPVTVAERVETFLDAGFFSASASGILVYRTGGGGVSQPTWFDRQGKVLRTAGEPGNYFTLALSPDGARAAVRRLDPNLSLWLLDFSRGTTTRFTFGSFEAWSSVWSPDGNRIIFASHRNGVYDLYQKMASGAKDEELLLKSSETKYPSSWSRDGRFLLYTVLAPNTTKGDLWVLPLEGDKKPFPFLRTEFNSGDGQFSPDGHWVAYVSDESGRNEIYVQTFSPDSGAAASGTGGKWLISTGGGNGPRWRRDGKELYYVASDGRLMAVEVTTKPGFQAGVPKVLFQAPPQTGVVSAYQWDVTPDGKRFLFLAPTEQGTAPSTVVLNWQAGLKK